LERFERMKEENKKKSMILSRKRMYERRRRRRFKKSQRRHQVFDIQPLDEKRCEAFTIQFLVSRTNKIHSLVRAIGMSGKRTAKILNECMGERKLVSLLKEMEEKWSKLSIVKQWIQIYFPFISKEMSEWEEREITSFFRFLKMDQVEKAMVEKGFDKGTALIKMDVLDWERMGLKLGWFRQIEYWIEEFKQSHPRGTQTNTTISFSEDEGEEGVFMDQEQREREDNEDTEEESNEDEDMAWPTRTPKRIILKMNGRIYK